MLWIQIDHAVPDPFSQLKIRIRLYDTDPDPTIDMDPDPIKVHGFKWICPSKTWIIER